MSRLAVIGTFYRRPHLYPGIAAAIRAQTRAPDEMWCVYEDPADFAALSAQDWGPAELWFLPVKVPRDADGRPTVVPPSLCINAALDLTGADLITYLTDDSIPLPGKYAAMVRALKDHGAVYCSQDYSDSGAVRWATEPEPSPFCRVDHTQVAHRRSIDRWPTDLGTVRFSDGVFFRDLVERFGPLAPIPEVLDRIRQLPDGISARW